MRVLLAGPQYEENLSIRYLSACLLSAGHETVLAAFNSTEDTMSVADAARDAGIAGLSMCFQSRAQEFLRLAQLIKARDPKKLIVAGGHYASCAAEPLLGRGQGNGQQPVAELVLDIGRRHPVIDPATERVRSVDRRPSGEQAEVPW